MRPVRLTLSAFGPFSGREVVDFRDAVQAGLFGIYGQTGSGKSTLFSAMTFALFGQPARDDQDAPSLRADHADPAQMTEVEFVFDVAGRRYVALRRPEQMRPKARGEGETRQAHEAFLFDATGLAPEEIGAGQRGKIVAEKKVGLVDTAISDLLGYGAEQFRQIVLLPQGRFETFLTAKTRDRQAILRDLFDVSLYRDFAARLKADAAEAERTVRAEREVCARRLGAEGFESLDALADRIAGAETSLLAQVEDEAKARVADAAAQQALAEGQALAGQFAAASEARAALADLMAGKAAIDALGTEMQRAEAARRPVDAEAALQEADEGLASSMAELEAAREADAKAAALSRDAAEVLAAEEAREGEIDDLRREVERLERHAAVLARSEGLDAELAQASALEQAAARALETAEQGLTARQVAQREAGEQLRMARAGDVQRRDLGARREDLRQRLAAAETRAAALDSRRAAEAQAAERAQARDAAAARATTARAAMETAEAALARRQAVHIAAQLVPGAPCPVCGGTDHPAPATGMDGEADESEALRRARAAHDDADARWRQAEQAQSAAESLLAERARALDALPPSEDVPAVLREDLAALQAQLDALGPAPDISALEERSAALGHEIEALQGTRDRARADHSAAQGTCAALNARRDEMLSPVPEALRDGAALASASGRAKAELHARRAALVQARESARAAAEAALAARKEAEAADKAQAACRARRDKAAAAFRERLAEAGLNKSDFDRLKPAIARIETDRARIEDYRRRLAIAEETAERAGAAVQGLFPPDLAALAAGQQAAAEALTEATARRTGAEHERNRLQRLRDELAETQRRLDEAEAASGPLRGLAALTGGENGQKLELETYAIGAMFDQVLGAANLRLGPMTSGRYRLERDVEGGGRGRRGLGIQVFDLHTGKARPTTTLSGGETFIAALALALGLADVVESASGKVRLDTIFIDEGFGSLDTENGAGTLDQVLQVLGGLVSDNRAVGLISHVPLVQEAIPNGFYVRKRLGGSRVEARGLD